MSRVVLHLVCIEDADMDDTIHSRVSRCSTDRQFMAVKKLSNAPIKAVKEEDDYLVNVAVNEAGNRILRKFRL